MKKLITGLLSFILVFSLVSCVRKPVEPESDMEKPVTEMPTSAESAGEEPVDEDPVIEDMPQEPVIIAQGDCGDYLAWTLDNTGLLSVTGSGEMDDYSATGVLDEFEVDTPWDNLREQIVSVHLPEGLTSIGTNAFFCCTNLRSATIPDSVTNIGRDAFFDTGFFKNHSNWSNGLLYLDKWLIDASSDVVNVEIRPGTKGIGDEAFIYCSNLLNISLSDSLTYIGDNAFAYCSSLTNVSIPFSVKSVGNGAFYDTGYYNDQSNWSDELLYLDDWLIRAQKTVVNAEILSGTKGIADSAFYSCEDLSSVTIPNSVEHIGIGAFCNCKTLANIIIPSSVLHIGENVFGSCCNLQEIAIASDNPYYISIDGVLFDKDCKTLIQYPAGKHDTSYTIPDGVTRIGLGAFRNCCNLTNVTIPNSVTSIGNMAFLLCENLTSMTIPDGVTRIGEDMFGGCYCLENVMIPDSVTRIDDWVFSCCHHLTSVSIPNSVIHIGGMAFYACSRMVEILVASDNPNFISMDGVLFSKDCSTLIQYPAKKPDVSYIIPDSVTTIRQDAFYCCDYLENLTIPDSVTNFEGIVFDGNAGLTIIAHTGSAAETYAKENDIPFSPVG